MWPKCRCCKDSLASAMHNTDLRFTTRMRDDWSARFIEYYKPSRRHVVFKVEKARQAGVINFRYLNFRSHSMVVCPDVALSDEDTLNGFLQTALAQFRDDEETAEQIKAGISKRWQDPLVDSASKALAKQLDVQQARCLTISSVQAL